MMEDLIELKVKQLSQRTIPTDILKTKHKRCHPIETVQKTEEKAKKEYLLVPTSKEPGSERLFYAVE
jgi:hypothetical protein